MIRTPRPGPGNGWRQHDLVGQAELAAEPAHLVLEQRAQRLDQLQRHVLGQAADVVVALDHRRRAVAAAALDDVGVQRPLDEELGVGQPAGVLLEDPHEQLADRLALLLRVGRRRRAARSTGRRRRRGSARCPCCAGTSRPPARSRRGASGRCRRRCTSAVARSPVHERCRDGRVDAAAERADHPARRRPARAPRRSAAR